MYRSAEVAREGRVSWGFLRSRSHRRMLDADGLAEREGFEPPIRLPVCRISSAVLSTTQPPLRGRKRRKHPVGRGLCIQRETAKQGRSVAPCKRLIVARDRAGGRRT